MTSNNRKIYVTGARCHCAMCALQKLTVKQSI